MSQGRTERTGRAGDDLREVLLTLSAAEFEEFARDLNLLREHCPVSSTQAIVEAVRERVMSVRVLAVEDRRAA